MKSIYYHIFYRSNAVCFNKLIHYIATFIHLYYHQQRQ